MNKREAAIVTAYTGALLGNVNDFHNYAEEKYGRPILSHMFAYEQTWNKLKELSREDFISIKIEE